MPTKRFFSGLIFEREGENSPDYGGFIDVDPDDVGELVEYLKTKRHKDSRSGKTVIRFHVTSSRKTGQRGEFLTVQVSEMYKKPREAAAQVQAGEENQDVPF